MKALVGILLIVLCFGVLPAAEGGEKVVLIEIFTNTGCPPCVPANVYFQNWLSVYEKKDRVAVIKYHVWWPQSNDPFYVATSHLVPIRRTYYGFNSVPWAFIDGILNGQYFHTTWPGLIESRMDVTPPFALSLSGDTSEESNNIEVTVASTGEEIPAGTLRLFIVVVESNIEYTGNNGAPVHYFVMRDMLTGASGETFTINLNEEKNFTKSFNWNSNWEFDNSKIVVFVQVEQSKEVLQAIMIPVDEIGDPTSVIAGTGDVPSSLMLYQNFPNPFNPSTVIRYGLPEQSRVRLDVYNVMGQRVASLVDGVLEAGYHEVTWNSDGAASGVYFYRIESISAESASNRSVEVKSMLLMK